MASLDALFAPKSIAVLGASHHHGKLGAVMAKQMSGFPGSLALVNPGFTDGTPHEYPSLRAIIDDWGTGPELVIACLPAGAAVAALDEAAQCGVRAAVVCAGGFAEVDAAGAQLQEQLAALARSSGMRILGPNTSGFVAPARSITASFVPGATELAAGTVGVVAASGGVNHAIAFALAAEGIGLDVAVGLGNGVDIAAHDVLDHLADSPTVTCVALHVESVVEGAALLAAVSRLSSRVPVVAVVVGRGDVADFARSHTGALATSWRTTRAALAQAGAALVDDERELVDAVIALSRVRLPAGSAARIGLVTGQAGPGLLLADGLRSRSVLLPELSEGSQARLNELLPPLTFQRNPVDTGRPGPTFGEVLDVVADDPGVDLLAVYGLLEPAAVDLAASVAGAARHGPTLAVIGGPAPHVATARSVLGDVGVPVFTSPAAAVRGIRALRDDALARGRTQRRSDGRPLVPDIDVTLSEQPNEHLLKEHLKAAGVAVPDGRVCADHVAALDALAELGGPVVVKLLEPVVAHKSEVGGVFVGIRTKAEMGRALIALDGVGAKAYLVEEMVAGSLEVLVGALRDPVFGPCVMVGLGGVAAEALADVSMRVLPVHGGDVEDMVSDLALSALLQGFRGAPPLDIAALQRVVSVVAQVVISNPGVSSFEVNPVRITPEGSLVALDATVSFDHRDIPEEGEAA